jgi:hypothetical protein
MSLEMRFPMRDTEIKKSDEPPPSPAALDRLRQALSRIAQEEEKETALKCGVCQKPITLETTGICADEDGKAVHENCYIQRLLSSRNDPPNPNHAE